MSNPEQPQVKPRETEKIIQIMNKTLVDSVEGDVVEFGCFRGDTSVLLQKSLLDFYKTSASPLEAQKSLWLYDSFAGLPEKTIEDSSSAGDAFKSGELFVTKREVIEKFRRLNLPVPIIKKAFFSSLSPEKDLPGAISFAFLDGDLYSSIKTSLSLVAPRLSERGIIIVHDYNNPKLPGSARAVDEFFKLNPNYSISVFCSLAIISEKRFSS